MRWELQQLLAAASTLRGSGTSQALAAGISQISGVMVLYTIAGAIAVLSIPVEPRAQVAIVVPR